MVVLETDMMPDREVESATQSDHQQAKHGVGSASASAAGDNNHNPFPLLGRQSSIYSLTLDEFQHALCESGKNFGSMNMDEFLVSIWNAEENQQASVPVNGGNNGFSNVPIGEQVESGVVGSSSGDMSNGKRGIAKQPSLPRQGSLTLPAPLCRKTVDEVWSEIHRGQLGNSNQNNNGGDSNGNGNNGTQNAENAARQPTFGEMTLEDFLIKAGVVREQTGNPNQTPIIPAAQQQHYGVFQGAGVPSFPSQSMAVGGDASGFMSSGKRTGTGGGYAQVMPTQPGVCYGGRVPTSGGVGYVPGQQVAAVGPLSPVSSDGLGHGQVESMGGQFGVDLSALRGRKRTAGDGPVEKVVERRQRRMIKNRESAARSRARKQAYTVELEAELNQLKEENAQLKHALAELERKRKQQFSQHPEETKTKTQSKSSKAKERMRTLRRNTSCPL